MWPIRHWIKPVRWSFMFYVVTTTENLFSKLNHACEMGQLKHFSQVKICGGSNLHMIGFHNRMESRGSMQQDKTEREIFGQEAVVREEASERRATAASRQTVGRTPRFKDQVHSVLPRPDPDDPGTNCSSGNPCVCFHGTR